jgi:hypothetical protein
MRPLKMVDHTHFGGPGFTFGRLINRNDVELGPANLGPGRDDLVHHLVQVGRIPKYVHNVNRLWDAGQVGVTALAVHFGNVRFTG